MKTKKKKIGIQGGTALPTTHERRSACENCKYSWEQISLEGIGWIIRHGLCCNKDNDRPIVWQSRKSPRWIALVSDPNRLKKEFWLVADKYFDWFNSHYVRRSDVCGEWTPKGLASYFVFSDSEPMDVNLIDNEGNPINGSSCRFIKAETAKQAVKLYKEKYGNNQKPLVVCDAEQDDDDNWLIGKTIEPDHDAWDRSCYDKNWSC